MTNIAFIGFGEAARAFLDGLRAEHSVNVATYDIKLDGPQAAEIEQAAAARDVRVAPTAADAIAGAEFVFSAVTAGSAEDALRLPYGGPVAPHVLFDINSVSSGVKRINAERVRAAGARYVDMAVMAPVHPDLHRTPVFVAGDTDAAVPFLTAHGFKFEVIGPEPGQATAIKMVRSLFVKGLEAITTQALTAAVASGCEERVLASLAKSYPGLNLPSYGAYQFDRVTVHGKRRAEEVREVARTMRELGFPAGGALADGIADVQDAFARAKTPLSDDTLACAAAAVTAFRKLEC